MAAIQYHRAQPLSALSGSNEQFLSRAFALDEQEQWYELTMWKGLLAQVLIRKSHRDSAPSMYKNINVLQDIQSPVVVQGLKDHPSIRPLFDFHPLHTI